MNASLPSTVTLLSPSSGPACDPLQAAAKAITYRNAIDVIGGSNYFKGSQVAPVIDLTSGQLTCPNQFYVI